MMQNYENNLRLTIILPTLFIYFSKNTTINVYCLVFFQNAHDSSPLVRLVFLVIYLELSEIMPIFAP